MKAIIDRFEEKYAVVELNEKMYNIPRALIPHDAREGDTIEITVLGKETPEGADEPHTIFERLREKNRDKSKAPKKQHSKQKKRPETDGSDTIKTNGDNAAESE